MWFVVRTSDPIGSLKVYLSPPASTNLSSPEDRQKKNRFVCPITEEYDGLSLGK